MERGRRECRDIRTQRHLNLGAFVFTALVKDVRVREPNAGGGLWHLHPNTFDECSGDKGSLCFCCTRRTHSNAERRYPALGSRIRTSLTSAVKTKAPSFRCTH
ncbi:hypothetical protein ISCGN_007552 [Ixodes scapularis]